MFIERCHTHKFSSNFLHWQTQSFKPNVLKSAFTFLSLFCVKFLQNYNIKLKLQTYTMTASFQRFGTQAATLDGERHRAWAVAGPYQTKREAICVGSKRSLDHLLTPFWRASALESPTRTFRRRRSAPSGLGQSTPKNWKCTRKQYLNCVWTNYKKIIKFYLFVGKYSYVGIKFVLQYMFLLESACWMYWKNRNL